MKKTPKTQKITTERTPYNRQTPEGLLIGRTNDVKVEREGGTKVKRKNRKLTITLNYEEPEVRPENVLSSSSTKRKIN